MGFITQSAPDFSNTTFAPTPDQMPDDPIEPAGFLESTGDFVQAGLMTSGQAFWATTFGSTAVAVDWVTSKLTGQLSTEQQDIIFGQIVDPSAQMVQGMNYRERTMAGRLTYGIGKVLTEFAAGGAGAMAVSEFSGRATSEVLLGKSAFDANMLALNQAAWAYAGAALPGALGGTLATKAATGAGINVAAGIGQRATEKGVLTLQGDERAATSSVFGLEDIVIDAVLGAAFGTLEPTRTRAVEPLGKPDGRAIDAAMHIDRARFEDAQVRSPEPAIQMKADRGLAEVVAAKMEGRAPVVEPLPDAVTMPPWLPEVKASRDVVVPELDDVTTAIAKLGGLNRVEAEAQGIDPAYFNERRGIKPLFRKEGGATFDQMAERLDELGYPVRDEQGRYDANKVLEVVDRALRGEQILTPQGADRANEIEGWRRMQEENRLYAERMAEEDAEFGALWEQEGKDISRASEDDIAAAFGTKPDPQMKAMKAELTEWQESQVDLSQPLVEDVDPATVAEVRAQAQALEDSGRLADDAELIEAARYAENVRSISDIMGCMLTIGVSSV